MTATHNKTSASLLAETRSNLPDHAASLAARPPTWRRLGLSGAHQVSFWSFAALGLFMGCQQAPPTVPPPAAVVEEASHEELPDTDDLSADDEVFAVNPGLPALTDAGVDAGR